MKEYGRKPYMSKSYNEMMKRITNMAMYNIRPEKHSEFEKPYRADSYSDMQHYYPTNHLPGADYPGMPVGGIPVDETGMIIFACYGDFCYCEGATRCAEIACSFPITRIEPIWCDPCVTFTISGNEVCVTVAEGCHIGICSFVVWMIATTTGGSSLGYRGPAIKVVPLTRPIESWQKMNINECSDCCVCTGISIGYTTLGMQVDEVQELTVTGAVAGCTYNWALTGGGELSAATGTTVNYTAPSANEGCTDNATITLTVEGEQCDSITIAINASASEDAAYEVVECIYVEPYWRRSFTGYLCTGEEIGTAVNAYYNTEAECAEPGISYYCPNSDPLTFVPGKNDCRSLWDPPLTNCCPEGLL